MTKVVWLVAVMALTGCAALNQPNEFKLNYDGTTESVTMETKNFWGASAAAAVSVEVEASNEGWSIKINSQENQSPEGQVTMTSRFLEAAENVLSAAIGFLLGRR